MADKDTTKKDIAKPAAKKQAVAKKTTPRKTAAPKTTAKPAEKPVRKPAAEAAPVTATAAAAPAETTFAKPTLAKGKYVFATGRRKTAVANVRLFAGSEDSLVNKKKLDVYFGQAGHRDAAARPLALTGLIGDFHFLANVH